jgi:hypothetical protein
MTTATAAATLKTCGACNEPKSTLAFHAKADASDGLYPYCKDCRRAKGGHTKRQPPRVREARADASYEDLIEDVIDLSRRQPSNIRLREAVADLRKNPAGTHSDYINDLLYTAWESRQKHAHDFADLDERVPVLTAHKEKRNRNSETFGLFDEREW